jgi:hypothetical protein
VVIAADPEAAPRHLRRRDGRKLTGLPLSYRNFHLGGNVLGNVMQSPDTRRRCPDVLRRRGANASSAKADATGQRRSKQRGSKI